MQLLLKFSSVQFSRSVVSDSLWPHGLQHVRPPCPSPTPRVYSYSCPLSQWWHPTISSSIIPLTQFFAWGGQSIGVSASASVLPMNIRDWFPLGLTDWISLQSKGLSRVFSNTTVQKQHFGVQMYNRLKGRRTREIITGSLYTFLWTIIWEL